jgi:hypothetical protein
MPWADAGLCRLSIKTNFGVEKEEYVMCGATRSGTRLADWSDRPPSLYYTVSCLSAKCRSQRRVCISSPTAGELCGFVRLAQECELYSLDCIRYSLSGTNLPLALSANSGHG